MPHRPSTPRGRARPAAATHHPYLLSPHTTGPVLEDTWPTLFFGEEAVAEVARKVRDLPWARQAADRLQAEADAVLQTPPCLPVEAAGWRHDFYSRRTAEHLLYEPDRPDAFLDPASGEREGDDAQHRAWVLLTHERTCRLMRSLGLLHRLTGDPRYARWVADGLRQAADYYTHTEFRRQDTGGPALYFSNLYDAAMLLLLGNAYSLVRTSPALTDDDHGRIVSGIFEDRMPSMAGFLRRQPTHNMSCFVSGALAYSGLLLDRPDWVDLGLGEESGLATQLRRGLPTGPDGRCDGFWYEGTTFYHFYSLCPLVTLWELDRRRGGHLTRDPDLQARFAAMFSAPVQMLDPQLRLPLVGDLGAPRTLNLAGYRHLYEYAAGRVDPDTFGPVLAAVYAGSGTPRGGLAALAYGPDELPPPGGVPTTSTVLPVAGLGVFRTAGPEQIHLTFRCGRYAGGHDHPDRLTLALSAFGEPISPDLGEPGYSLREAFRGYYRTTLAHNTLSADEASQTGAAVLDWRPDARPPRARGTTDRDGIRYRRTVFVDTPLIVLLDEFDAGADHRYGWTFHAYGPVTATGAESAPAGEPVLGMPVLATDGPLALLTDRHTGLVRGLFAAAWQVSTTLGLQLHAVADGPFEATVGVTPGQPAPDRLGTLLFRLPGQARRLAAVLEPHTAAPTVAAVTLAGSAVTVTRTDGRTTQYGWGS